MALPIEPELLAYQPDWTVAQYERMVATGIFHEADRVELLFGRIITQLPITDRHSFCVQELNYYMIRHFGDRFIGRQEQPVSLLSHSVPEPDYVLATPHPHRYRNRKPGAEDIQLIIEVADATLDRDRGAKARLYGMAGIREYWIINLVDDCLEVHTQPNIQAGGYGEVKVYHRGEQLAAGVLGALPVNDIITA